ncbi:MAG: hypothetical protein AAB853_02905, partial [Patescibacteria group bacterium]
MSPREIIAEAWAITRKYRRVLLPWGIIDAFTLSIYATVFATYQGYVLWFFFRGQESPSWLGTIEMVINTFSEHPAFTGVMVILGILYALLWLTIPRLATGALIGLAAKIRSGDEPRGGLVLGVFNFFPLLELAVALGLIGGKTIFSAWSVLVRTIGEGPIIPLATSLLLVLWLLSFVFHFL